MPRLTKAACYEQATRPVSDLEAIFDELDQIQDEAPKSQRDCLEDAKRHLQHAVNILMDLDT